MARLCRYFQGVAIPQTLNFGQDSSCEALYISRLIAKYLGVHQGIFCQGTGIESVSGEQWRVLERSGTYSVTVSSARLRAFR